VWCGQIAWQNVEMVSGGGTSDQAIRKPTRNKQGDKVNPANRFYQNGLLVAR
jgi:hypothetical protein